MQSRESAFSLLRISIPKIRARLCFASSISSLKVVWKKDPKIDQAIENDKKWRLCARVVREVLNEPGRAISLRYLDKRRERLRLPVNIEAFLKQNPGLFDIYMDRSKPKSDLVKFVRPSERLNRFLEEERLIYEENEALIVSKLCKLLMMAKDRVISVDKLLEVKREFGFPNDFVVNLVPKYPDYFKVHGNPGEGKSFLELLSWNQEFATSAVEKRAEDEHRLTGIKVRPHFTWKLPPGFFLKKEMREWVRDWIELPYISPYEDASHLDSASREMEKRMVGVLHEMLSLSVYRRVPVSILGKFCEEYRFSNAFSSVFTRHSGIFYMSLKGGIRTAVLREAYKGEELMDCDPLLKIKDKFVELMNEGREMRAKESRLRRERISEEMKVMAFRNGGLNVEEDL